MKDDFNRNAKPSYKVRYSEENESDNVGNPFLLQ